MKSIKVISMSDILFRAFTISNYSRLEESQRRATIHFKPPIEAYNAADMSMNKFDEMVEIGYEYANQELGKLDYISALTHNEIRGSSWRPSTFGCSKN